MPLFMECVENHITLGEICNTLRVDGVSTWRRGFRPLQLRPNPTMKIFYLSQIFGCRIWGCALNEQWWYEFSPETAPLECS